MSDALTKAVKRLKKSPAAQTISFPSLSIQQLIKIHKETRHLETPIYIGVMPLTSSRNAEFIHNEIPGIKLSDSIREKMALAGNDKQKQAEEGLAIAALCLMRRATCSTAFI